MNGRDYHFVDRASFERMIAAGDFLEYAEVYGNYYGTSKRWIETELAGDHDVLLEIDWQGAQQVRSALSRHGRDLHPSPLARGAAPAPGSRAAPTPRR